MTNTGLLPRGGLLPPRPDHLPPLAAFLGQTMFTHLTLQVPSLKIQEKNETLIIKAMTDRKGMNIRFQLF